MIASHVLAKLALGERQEFQAQSAMGPGCVKSRDTEIHDKNGRRNDALTLISADSVY